MLFALNLVNKWFLFIKLNYFLFVTVLVTWSWWDRTAWKPRPWAHQMSFMVWWPRLERSQRWDLSSSCRNHFTFKYVLGKLYGGNTCIHFLPVSRFSWTRFSRLARGLVKVFGLNFMLWSRASGVLSFSVTTSCWNYLHTAVHWYEDIANLCYCTLF